MLELQLKREAQTLTEGFFLYRLIVLCPEQTKSSTANENSEHQPAPAVRRRGPKSGRLIWLNHAGTAQDVLLRPFRAEAKQAKSLWDVERVTHRGLPDNLGSVRRRPLAAKQIDSKPVAN